MLTKLYLMHENDPHTTLDVNDEGFITVNTPGFYAFRRPDGIKKRCCKQRYICTSPIGIAYPGTYQIDITGSDSYTLTPIDTDKTWKVMTMW